jgi:magnesium transporter
MLRLLKPSKRVGLPPGTLEPSPEPTAEDVTITVIDYDEDQVQEKQVETVDECFSFKDRPTVTWINVNGIHDVKIIEKLGEHFGLHTLVLEDIMHIGQRPKIEDFENLLFVVIRMLRFDEETGQVAAEQVSLVLGEGFVISFQEREGDVFEPIRQRIREAKGRIRRKGSDHLAYALLDTIVDNYFIILERLGQRIEEIETTLVGEPTPESLQVIHGLRTEMVFLRQSIWPLREVIGSLERGESPLVQESTQIFLRDLYDHTIQVIETTESFREMVGGLRDTYLSSISNRMNEVMKVLTIIATIFIPLTFIAGIYGMNFSYMPELQWRSGYFLALSVMVVVAAAMGVYFRRKKWL